MTDEPLRAMVANFRTRAEEAYGHGRRFDPKKHHAIKAQYISEGHAFEYCARELEKWLDGQPAQGSG